MAIKRESHAKKAPSQNPVGFFKSEQQGGAHGKPMNVPDKLTGGPMREPVMGYPVLAKQTPK